LVVLAAPAAWRWAWAGFAVVALLSTWWADRSAAWPVDHRTRAPARASWKTGCPGATT